MSDSSCTTFLIESDIDILHCSYYIGFNFGHCSHYSAPLHHVNKKQSLKAEFQEANFAANSLRNGVEHAQLVL